MLTDILDNIEVFALISPVKIVNQSGLLCFSEQHTTVFLNESMIQ